MKIRHSFVSNSSSTAFIIINKAKRDKKLEHFCRENIHLLENWRIEYSHCTQYTKKAFIESAKNRSLTLIPGINYVIFGDKDGDAIGQVFDYILRDGGESKNYSWKFFEYHR